MIVSFCDFISVLFSLCFSSCTFLSSSRSSARTKTVPFSCWPRLKFAHGANFQRLVYVAPSRFVPVDGSASRAAIRGGSTGGPFRVPLGSPRNRAIRPCVPLLALMFTDRDGFCCMGKGFSLAEQTNGGYRERRGAKDVAPYGGKRNPCQNGGLAE